VVPVELLGVLRTANQRAIVFDNARQRFKMARGGYRGFRLYAASIDDVPYLYHRLKDEGIEVMAEVEAIERIQILNQGLTRLFWLIALLGLFGGTAVLVSSLYAAVERRRRDLGVLRLLGFARNHVFFFPIAQGIIIAIMGLLAGFGGYAVLAGVINHAFSSELAPGEAFCVLPNQYIPVFCLTTLVMAALASLVAAWRATSIDPAEVIREQ
jgi:putative ABC transport system permease protein